VFDWQPATLTCFHDITTRRLAEAALKEELDRKRAELDEARTLQLQLAPPPFQGRSARFDVRLDVLLDPAKEVGGDLVDHFELADDLRVLVLGDVSNKGAGAALVMARAHALFRAIAARPDAEALFRAPERVMALVNAALVKDNPSCMFLSLLLATFDGATGTLTYARGGHIPPFLHRGQAPRMAPSPASMPRAACCSGFEEDAALQFRRGRACAGRSAADRHRRHHRGEQPDPADVRRAARRGVSVIARARRRAAPLSSLLAQVRAYEAGLPAFDDIAALLLELRR
jgi:sigma-B regulation protein RsbU (phosphoserine phosphatase)